MCFFNYCDWKYQCEKTILQLWRVEIPVWENNSSIMKSGNTSVRKQFFNYEEWKYQCEKKILQLWRVEIPVRENNSSIMKKLNRWPTIIELGHIDSTRGQAIARVWSTEASVVRVVLCWPELFIWNLKEQAVHTMNRCCLVEHQPQGSDK